MSWWTKTRDKYIKVASAGAYDPAKSREMERQQRYMINDQISAYKEQTNLAREQLNETRNQTDVERRRVQEKQIRSLRRSYRATGLGLLGTGEPASPDMNTKLGG